ncbi:cytochrome c biogenesis protein CcdA [Phormidium sp. LEGE 05292]|uniref:cytochrome c biogenesis protein CcdA n=1 Tax=[Phormidium] sp. LEGE 05292 TaxID=767427 RepID=UPI00187E1FFF|nr:cytochrome c biogenesis protein CcdA [Phormidium sp. LEGE 05292]MBE9227060.1 cytochrome c biogenesis protein CcdA [Phormidium sp. LEGE 05292]
MTLSKWFAEKLTKPKSYGWYLFGLLFGFTFLVILASKFFSENGISETIDNFVLGIGDRYQQWFSEQNTNNPLVLFSLSFAGGLIASISPCILSLLPINLTYIGTREIKSRWDAFGKAGAFVLGVVTMLSLFGILSSFATIILLKYRGFVQLTVGAIVILMALSLLGIIRLPLPKTNFKIPIAGAYGVGLTFALVSSPCTSPIMFAVLAAASATGSQMQTTLAMVCYAIGYTAVIFFASLFAGLAKQTRGLLKYSEKITHLGSLALIIIGAYYLIDGISWIVSTIKH